MSLVGELELPLHVVLALLVWLDTSLGFALVVLACLLWGLDLLLQVFVSNKQLHRVNFADLAQWDVWNLMLESAVDVDVVV